MHESGSADNRINSGMESERHLTCYAVHAATRTPYLVQRLGVWEEIREPVSHVRWSLTVPGWPEDVRQRLLYHSSLIPRALSASLVGIRVWDILRYVPRDAWEKLPLARGDAHTNALLRLAARYPEPMETEGVSTLSFVATLVPETKAPETAVASPAKRKRVRRPKATSSKQASTQRR